MVSEAGKEDFQIYYSKHELTKFQLHFGKNSEVHDGVMQAMMFVQTCKPVGTGDYLGACTLN